MDRKDNAASKAGSNEREIKTGLAHRSEGKTGKVVNLAPPDHAPSKADGVCPDKTSRVFPAKSAKKKEPGRSEKMA